MKEKPRTRDPVRTRSRILRDATRLFARSGYDGTSTYDIVLATGFNKRMIYHYFGDKKGLYRAVFLQQWAEMKEWVDQAPRRHPPGTPETLTESLEILFDFFAAHQTFVRLLLWEGLEGGSISRSIWKEVRGPLFVQFESMLRQAQRAKILDHRLDPIHLIIDFLGAISYYFAYAPSIQDMLGKPALSPAALEERKTQLVRLLECLLTPSS